MPVNPSLVAGFLVLSALLSAVPGPSVVLETSRAITRGRRAAMPIVLGNALGGLVLLGLVLAGLGAIVAASARLFLAVKFLGAGYLLWLGVRSIRAARDSGDDFSLRAVDPRSDSGTAVREGFLVGVSNPKSIVALMAILPQFVDRGMGHPTLQMLLIGVAGAIAQVAIETLWVCAAGLLRRWFQQRPRRVGFLKAGGGIAMVGFAGRLAIER